MEEGSLSNTKRERKYHVVFIPKNRRESLYGELRRDLSVVVREVARQREHQIAEDHPMPDHVRMLISIPAKYSVSQGGYVKGKSAIHIARVYGGKRRHLLSQTFWARGFFASTVGRDEGGIRRYISHQ